MYGTCCSAVTRCVGRSARLLGWPRNVCGIKTCCACSANGRKKGGREEERSLDFKKVLGIMDRGVALGETVVLTLQRAQSKQTRT